MCERLEAAHAAGKLVFFGDQTSLSDPEAFHAFLRPLRHIDWVTYAKAPFAGPDSVLAYLARYTHRVAIANSRLLAFDDARVSFKYKDYRADGAARQKIMTIESTEFIRRFLLHVLPDGFHRIRHYGLFANGGRVDNIAKARALLADVAPAPPVEPSASTAEPEPAQSAPCPCCGGRMILVEIFERGATPSFRRWSPTPEQVDTS